MAVAESMTMNATQAMKMNMIFWNSPMPNSENVSGIRAATGMLRPMIVSGAKKALTRRKAAAQHAQRHADHRRQAEAQHHAAQAGPACCGSAPGRTTGSGSSPNVSAGLGRMLGLRIRSSAVSPAVRHHHDAAAQHDAQHAQQHGLPARDLAAQREAAAARARRGRGMRQRCCRLARQLLDKPAVGARRLSGWRIGLIARAHRVVPLLLLGRIDLDLHAAVLGVVQRVVRIGRPVPAHARRPRTGSGRA